jgi:hypothetical protein
VELVKVAKRLADRLLNQILRIRGIALKSSRESSYGRQ